MDHDGGGATVRGSSPGTGLVLVLALLAALPCGEARADAASAAGAGAPRGASWPVIRQIAFEGNKTTQAEVLRRELLVQEGDAADPELVERSRQAILNLGLFRDVTVAQQEREGGVELSFAVAERWYLLPMPRLKANSDGDVGYGAQLRWFNVGGMNHTLRVLLNYQQVELEDYDDRLSFAASYAIPFLGGSPYGLDLSLAHSESGVSGADGVAYDEREQSVQALVTASLAGTPRSDGWSVGGGLVWQSREFGDGADRPSPGMATALVATTTFRDWDYRVYSEVGQLFTARVEHAADGFGSDYGYTRAVALWREARPIGHREHETLHFIAEAGAQVGGGTDGDTFRLGGAEGLHGYEKNHRQGDVYYRVAAEYLRPLHWDWLRGLVILEAGDAQGQGGSFQLRTPLVSVGLGVRLRLTRFVNAELQLGVAFPLTGAGGKVGKPNVFAGGV